MAENIFDRFDSTPVEPNIFDRFDVINTADAENGLRHRVRSPEEIANAKRDFLEAPEQKQRWADINRRVAIERATDTGSPIFGTTGRDIIRNLGEGTPVGSWLDEANSVLADAAYKATENPTLQRIIGRRVGEPYQDRMDYHAAYDAQKDADSTVLGELPIIGEVTAGGLEKLAGGVMSAPLAPMARVFQGSSVLPQVGNAAVSGAGYGGGYGLGQGQGVDRFGNAAVGTGLGMAAGAAIPLVAGGLGNSYNAARNRLTPMPAELRGIDRNAATLVGDDFVAGGMADQNSPNYYPRQAQRLGQEATLMDMSRATENAGMGVAAAGGEGAENIAQALQFRRENAPSRINTEVDAALGPPVNTQDFIKGSRIMHGSAAKPLYDQFYATPIKTTPELDGFITRAAVDGDAGARKALLRKGLDPNLPSNNPIYIDHLKREIADQAGEALRKGRGSEARDLTQIYNGLLDETDRILSPNDPKQSVWAQARRIAGEGKQIEDAIELGREAATSGMTPGQLAAELRGMTPIERESVMMGYREKVRSEMGRSATQFRATPDNQARKLLNSNDAREKLGMVAGQPEARAVGRRIDTENRFAETEQRVLGGAITAERTAARERYAGGSNRDVNLRSASAAGMIAETVNRIGNALLRGAIDERRLRQLVDSSRLLSADGTARDQFARGLMQFGRQNARNHAQAQMIERAAQAILDSSRTKAIEGATE